MLPDTWDAIPANALKALPKFSGEDAKMLGEHLQDVSDVCAVHVITIWNVAIRLLVASFKGKALDWYRSLPPNSISTWDQLGDAFFARFSEKGDKSSPLRSL